MRLFKKSWRYYDAIYDAVGKDYRSEAQHLRRLIKRYKVSSGGMLLDVACGTGRHLFYLKNWFDVAGLDVNGKLLEVARNRNRTIPFYRRNMLTFDLPTQFDIITCLFSAIGHMRTHSNLRRAILNMSRHLKPGGVLIVEPWLTPRNFKSGTTHVVLVGKPELKLARVGRSLAQGRISTLDFWYIVATRKTLKCFREREEFGLFTYSEYINALKRAGLDPTYVRKGLIGRGLYIGVKR